MLEFTSVSATDPAALAAVLNERSAEGWTVVSIVSVDGGVSAILSRDGVTAAGSTGWAAAHPTPQPAAQQPAPQPTPQPAVQQAVQPSVPAQWAADPRGRYDLRYWDGTRWTEHVSRGGQQYVDPL